MNIIKIRKKEDMERILNFTHQALVNDINTEMGFPFDECRIDFEYEGFRLDAVRKETDFSFVVWIDMHMNEKIKEFVPVSDRYQKLCTFKYGAGENGYYLTEKVIGHDRISEMLSQLIEKDRTLHKLWMKYIAIMHFATAYHEVIEKPKVTAHHVQRKGKPKKGKSSTKLLYTREYVITGEHVTQAIKNRPRKKPDHEFGVRGHYRHYKSGKKVWIAPQTRCKGRKKSDNVYVV